MTDPLSTIGFGAAGALIVQIATLILQKRQIDVDDSSSLRKDLIAEREQMIGHVDNLTARMNAIETENHQLRLKQVDLEKQIGLLEVERERLRNRITHFETEVDKLETEVKKLRTHA